MPRTITQLDRRRAGEGDTPAFAHSSLRRHLAALGLEDAAAYRAWCRERGFGTFTGKTWRERRNELRIAQRDAAACAAREALRRHRERLGFTASAHYEEWCREHGFPVCPIKSPALLREECETFREESVRTALARARRIQRRPEELVEALARGEDVPECMRGTVYDSVHGLFEQIAASPSREPFLRLLLHCLRETQLVSNETALGLQADRWGRTWLQGLLALSSHHEKWLGPLEQWRPSSKNARRQFASLARHLLAEWEVPSFLDYAFFYWDLDTGRIYQNWFLHIGAGRNIRTAEGLPLTLTKRAAHLLTAAAPTGCSVEQALRWAQMRAMDAGDELARAVLGTRLGEEFAHEEFWEGVLRFFVNNPMLDRAQVGPIVDYIAYRKFDEQEIDGPGFEEVAPPPDPGFSMKGRTPEALLRLVDAWHRELARENRRPAGTWERSGITGLSIEEPAPRGRGTISWRLREIVTGQELIAEARAMNHCVSTYNRSCAKGHTSIWSLQVCRDGMAFERVMTIAVSLGQRTITQARGRFNRMPGDREGGEWLEQAPRLLNLWATREGLEIGRYL